MGATQNLDKFCEKFGHDLPIEEFSSATINVHLDVAQGRIRKIWITFSLGLCYGLGIKGYLLSRLVTWAGTKGPYTWGCQLPPP
jgi:hypothetical protein